MRVLTLAEVEELYAQGDFYIPPLHREEPMIFVQEGDKVGYVTFFEPVHKINTKSYPAESTDDVELEIPVIVIDPSDPFDNDAYDTPGDPLW